MDRQTISDPGADAQPRRLRRLPPWQPVALLAIGAVFGALTTLTWDQPGSTDEPVPAESSAEAAVTTRVVEGVVGAIDDTGSAIQLSEPAAESEIGYGIVGVLWRDTADGDGDGEDAPWQRAVADDGYPTCLDPGDVGRDVALGLVREPGSEDRPASEVVAWLECR
ncbi:hypothetical protein [Euzebya sp.]|uniref:hypothetical protein n=1 Tax=Euzebya sp. TaxID=1971409 RepID=UPI003518538F